MWDEGGSGDGHGVEDLDMVLPRDVVTPPSKKTKNKNKNRKKLKGVRRESYGNQRSRYDDDGASAVSAASSRSSASRSSASSADDRGLDFSPPRSTESKSKSKHKRKRKHAHAHQTIPIQLDIGTQLAQAEETEAEETEIEVPVSADEMLAGFVGHDACACCAFGLGEAPDADANPLHAQLQNFYLKHRAAMSLGALSRAVALFYEDLVRARMRDDGVDMPPWTAAQVEQHLVGHVQDPLLKIDAQIRMVHLSMREVANNMFARKEDGRIKVDIDYSKLLLSYQKRETDLLRERAKLL